MDTCNVLLEEVLNRLKSYGVPEKATYKKNKFGIDAFNALGVYQKDINIIAKDYRNNSALGIDLYNSGIYEAKILCSKIYDPKDLKQELMEEWVIDFDTWEICDSFCMILFAQSSLALPMIKQWATREDEYVRRASYATIAGLTMADKSMDNSTYESFYPLIIQASTDPRNFVKKAVNWALRSIGKRNRDLQLSAIKLSEELLLLNDKTADWIAKDALRELTKPDVRISDYPRVIYRK